MRALPALLATAALLAGAAVPAAAQEAGATLYACYVPLTGTVYRIKEPGLRQACATPSHVEFSWPAGLGEGSVHASHLAGDAVTTEKIRDGAVTEAKLGFDPATQVELDVFQGSLAVRGIPNDPANPVAWSRLKGIPEGFADGVDDAGGSSGDLDCVACVQEAEIDDEAVSSRAIRNGSIGGIDLAAGAVELTHIAPGAVREQHLWPESVVSGHLRDGAVTSPKIAPGAVRGGHVGDGEITGDHVQDGTLTAKDVGIASGVVRVDFPFMDPGRCWTNTFEPFGTDANDAVLVTRGTELPSGLATVAFQRAGERGIEIRICNTSGGFFDPGPISFPYIVFEIPGS